MSVYKCPHCTTVTIVVDPATYCGVDDVDSTCPQVTCRGVMEKLDEPDAGAAMRAAFYGHDHDFSSLTPAQTIEAAKAFNEDLRRLNRSLEGM